MELYNIYLQLPDNIRILIEISLLILVVLLFFMPFAVVCTNRRLTKLLESNNRVEENTHQNTMVLRELSWGLVKFRREDEVVSGETGFEDEDPTPTCITCEKCYHMNDIGAQICTRCASWL